MKNCRDCGYFNGYNYNDGMPDCSNTGGFEDCPYNGETSVTQKGMKIEIDAGFMHDYIQHTISNTVQNEACRIATEEIKRIIDDDIRSKIRSTMEEAVAKCVNDEVDAFMQKEIVVGGGWREPERHLTREQYLGELVETELGKRFKSEEITRYAENAARKAIEDFSRKTKESINANVKTMFNDITRATLTENVVNMLMCSDTYKKLSDSMNRFLE